METTNTPSTPSPSRQSKISSLPPTPRSPPLADSGYGNGVQLAACKACPARAQCTKSTIRKLIIRVHLETMDRARERLTAVPDAMRQRAALVEHPFGTLKDRHGYGGLLCRGLSLAGAEMGLSAWAYNFTRVINLVGTQGLLGAIRVRRMAAQGY